MVLIGLLDLPPEIRLHIAECVKGKRALKALSVSSRSLHSIAQSLLFKYFIINLEKKQQGSLSDMLANPQICAAIRSLVLFGPMSAKPPRNNEKKPWLIKERLPKMVRSELFRYPDQDHPCLFLAAYLHRFEPTSVVIGYPWILIDILKLCSNKVMASPVCAVPRIDGRGLTCGLNFTTTSSRGIRVATSQSIENEKATCQKYGAAHFQTGGFC